MPPIPRPILTSLNGDNSWLFSFPRPLTDRTATGKAYFHIVHDPWLAGPEIQYASWLVYLNLAAPAAVSSGDGVEAVVRGIEEKARQAGIVEALNSGGETVKEKEVLVDAISINLHYGDHLHAPTLRTFDKRIPIFTAQDAVKHVNALGHFETVVAYNDFEDDSNSDWTSLHPGKGLPFYLTIFRVRGHHELNFLSCMIWTASESESQLQHEAILYSPHGIHTSQPALQSLLHSSNPPFTTLALLHGLKESWTLNWQSTFGVKTGLELQRETEARYWVVTHDSKLKYGGLVWWVNTDIFRTLEWGLGQEGKEGNVGKKKGVVGVKEVENGGCVVLE